LTIGELTHTVLVMSAKKKLFNFDDKLRQKNYKNKSQFLPQIIIMI